MLRSLFVLTFVASVEASRVQTHSALDLEAKWGASCETLQNRFHTQVQTCQTALDATNSAESMGVASQGRLAMRMYGIVRTLRRARECAWVIDNNSEDIENMRGMTQQLLEGNPCGEAARAEMEAGAANDSQQGIARAISILASNDCQASEIQELPGDASPEQQLQEADEQAQDAIDELMDAEEGGAAFIQKSRSPTIGSFMRRVGVFFLVLFLVLACAGTLALIAMTIALFLTPLIFPGVGFGIFTVMFGAGLVAGVSGFAGCGSRLYNSFAAAPQPTATLH